MNLNLRSVFGIVTLLAATASVSEVNAQSNYYLSSPVYLPPSQPITGEIVTTAQNYQSVPNVNNVGLPQPYNWHPSPQKAPLSSWGPQFSPAITQSVPQNFHEVHYTQRRPVSSATYFPSAANVAGCQPGGT